MGEQTCGRIGMSCRITERNSCVFSVWAPEKKSMILHLTGSASDRPGLPAGDRQVMDQKFPMQKDRWGYFTIELDDPRHGDTYFFMPDGQKDYPDPASHFQPAGVDGPSGIVDHNSYPWQDAGWRGSPFGELILYELHVGAFTPSGTFEAIIPLLDDIAAIGVNAIELMPVAQFPGTRNWGYDGVFPYAVQNTYGGPEGLKSLVDACHGRGISVFLDVVYNHLGPEANCFDAFGPYFTERYRTPWGPALNFDGNWSDGVREYFIRNALHWFENYHIDGLRLDAIHEIYDRNAIPVWEQLHREVKDLERQVGRPLHLTAESDLNSPRVIRSPEMGGYGFDAQWMDDFHHALYVLLDKEGISHYQDFGRLDQLAKAYKDGFVHSGEWVQFRRRKHGDSSAGISGEHFIVFNQNHDLPGNRPGGERLSNLVDFERLKLAAGALLLAPYVPLLFMGEEYAEDAPFYFFSDYGDMKRASELREGRKKEFAAFNWDREPPDSQDPAVFQRSKLQWEHRREGRHAILLEWYRQLIRLRKTHPLLKDHSKNNLRVDLLGQSALALSRQGRDGFRRLTGFFNFAEVSVPCILPQHGTSTTEWIKLLDSKETPSLPSAILSGKQFELPPLSVTVFSIGDPA
jgi:maltooligosyltrehalose trehalohydrolase